MSNLVDWGHLAQTVLHFVQFGLGYLFMLIAMTFNVWLFLAIICGKNEIINEFLIAVSNP